MDSSTDSDFSDTFERTDWYDVIDREKISNDLRCQRKSSSTTPRLLSTFLVINVLLYNNRSGVSLF